MSSYFGMIANSMYSDKRQSTQLCPNQMGELKTVKNSIFKVKPDK